MMAKVKLHIVVSNAESNIVTTLEHTGISYPTRTIVHEVSVEIPDIPEGFALDRITISATGYSDD